jgi:hypothetical protein
MDKLKIKLKFVLGSLIYRKRVTVREREGERESEKKGERERE